MSVKSNIFGESKTMKRSEFLKRLGIGLGTVIVTPKAFADIKEETPSPTEVRYKKECTDRIKPVHKSEIFEMSTCSDNWVTCKIGDITIHSKPLPQEWYSRTFKSYRDPETGTNVYIAPQDE
jgi:hypothetical protein